MSASEQIRMPTRLLFSALLKEPERAFYGYEIIKITGMDSGTLYSILRRQTERGRLMSYKEDPSACEQGRPPRTYYWLTNEGRTFAEGIRVGLPDPVPLKEKSDLREPEDPTVDEVVLYLKGLPLPVLQAALRRVGMDAVPGSR